MIILFFCFLAVLELNHGLLDPIVGDGGVFQSFNPLPFSSHR